MSKCTIWWCIREKFSKDDIIGKSIENELQNGNGEEPQETVSSPLIMYNEGYTLRLSKRMPSESRTQLRFEHVI